MFAMLIFVSLVLLQFRTSLLNFTTDLSAELQNKCELLSPKNFVNSQWVTAVVCGKNPAQNSEYQLLQVSGLLHLIVVSGSHLVLIEQVLGIAFDRFRWRFFPKVVVLTLFAFTTGFQPPVVRALVSQVLNHWQSAQKLFWAAPAITLFAGMTCLALVPEWWTSLSLQLSWVAALALQSGFSDSAIKKQTAIFILMFPLLMQFAPPHPVSIAYNLLAGEFVGFVMFPFSAAAMAMPKQFVFVDTLWTWFFKFLAATVPTSYSPDPIHIGSKAIVWFYIFALNLFLIRRALRQKVTENCKQ